MRLAHLLVALSYLFSLHSFAASHVSIGQHGTVTVTKTSKKSINQTEPAKISGVVTFFFNDNYGNKPDIGSMVYLIKSDKTFSLNSTDSLLLTSVMLYKERGENEKRSSEYPVVASTRVDGVGRYELIGIQPGTYNIIIQSAQTKSRDSLGMLGKIFSSYVVVESGQVKDISNDFGMSER